jgi:DNA (cytosine-5)-methyltransferase 1
LWENVEVTAIEIDPQIAEIYQDFFPDDNVIITDAHQYLLEHYNEFDFIWSSPPCPTHSVIRRCAVHRGQNKALYADMTLYQEIILLKSFYKKDRLYCIENVAPYYEPLIKPSFILGRHYFWSNIEVVKIEHKVKEHNIGVNELQETKGFDLSNYKGINKIKILRNCVNPKIGLHVLNCARGKKTLVDGQKVLF